MSKDEFGTNKENTFNKDQDTYIETLVVYDKMVNVFLNDYGQCYWFQWVDNGELKSNSCGTYNSNYREEIEEYFKPEVEHLRESMINLRREVNELRRYIFDKEKDR